MKKEYPNNYGIPITHKRETIQAMLDDERQPLGNCPHCGNDCHINNTTFKDELGNRELTDSVICSNENCPYTMSAPTEDRAVLIEIHNYTSAFATKVRMAQLEAKQAIQERKSQLQPA